MPEPDEIIKLEPEPAPATLGYCRRCDCLIIQSPSGMCGVCDEATK